MELNHPNVFKFRAWTQGQAERFIAHIPDLLLFDTDYEKWGASEKDVIVTLQVHASLEQLKTILGRMPDMKVVTKTIATAKDFRPFG